jgi:ammonia channel protein AmtB
MSGSRFIGDLAHIASINVLDGPALGTATITDITFCFFELMFAATSTTSILILIQL